MSTFALDTTSSAGDIITGLNYALANLNNLSAQNLTANVLVANIQTGQVTTTSVNSAGYNDTTVVSYLYRYMAVKYANTATGSSGFTSNSRLANYFGLRNSSNVTISNNPADYVWTQVTGGFGTTKSLWYQTVGGRQIEFFAGNAAPQASYVTVPDNTALDLDTITSAQNNQIVNVNAYYQANATPATPSGGTYNFTTFTLTAPTGWSANIPSFVANTSVYISTAAFVGNTNATAVPPSTLWTVPAEYISQFQGNTGPAGSRGFVPMGYVLTASDPTLFSNANLTTAFSSSRSNPSPPIGLGFAPIANDTAQFAYQDLFTGNTKTIVKQYDGSGWISVRGNVISGDLVVPGSINANTLNANQVFALTIASTNAQVGNIASPGFWLDNVSGDVRFAGNTNIGNNLTVGTNANIGTNAVIGGNLSVGANASIGNNLTVANLITASSLNANTVNTNQLVVSSATQVVTVADNTNYPLLNFVNGNTVIGGTGYLWPPFTRGIVVSAPIIATTNGSSTGSAITVNWNTYLFSDTATSTYNLIELWRTGGEAFYQNTFTAARAYPIAGNVDTLVIPGTAGALYYGNLGTISQQISNTSNILFDGIQSRQGPTYQYNIFGAAGQYVYGGTLANTTSNVAAAVSTYSGSPASTALPLFDMRGVSTVKWQGTSVFQPTVIVGTDGRIALWVGREFAYSNGIWQFETSGTLNDLNDIAADYVLGGSSSTYTPAGTTINYVVAGANGTILYNARTYNTTGNVATTTGWSSASSGTVRNLNAVASNATLTISNTGVYTSTVGNTWVVVGDNGTILKSTAGSGPWTVAATIPTTNNINGVAYAAGTWVAVGDAGTVLYSTDASVWTAVTIPAVGTRNLYGVAGGYSSGRFVVAGQEIILTAANATVASTTWANSYVGGTSLNTQLTRLQYYGSWANVATVSEPPVQQRLTNGQVVSGTYTDVDYADGDSITYYLVAGNMSGNANVYTNSSSITVTEIKR